MYSYFITVAWIIAVTPHPRAHIYNSPGGMLYGVHPRAGRAQPTREIAPSESKSKEENPPKTAHNRINGSHPTENTPEREKSQQRQKQRLSRTFEGESDKAISHGTAHKAI